MDVGLAACKHDVWTGDTQRNIISTILCLFQMDLCADSLAFTYGFNC